jgi:hypothetical protein
MKLRDDPVVASAMAGILTQSNSFNLTGKIGRRPNDAELYMAHFMGVGGAAKLITNAEDNPKASGAQLFPNAAAANRSIFYDSTGRTRSVSEVYSVLTSRYASAANSQATRSAIAAVGGTPSTTAVASAAQAAPSVENAAFLQSFPDTRAAAPVTIASASAATNSAPADPNFRSLFQFGDRAQPVSSAVRELWGNSASLTSVTSATSVAPATSTQVAAATQVATANSAVPVATASSSTPIATARVPQGLDLFSDRNGTFSG